MLLAMKLKPDMKLGTKNGIKHLVDVENSGLFRYEGILMMNEWTLVNY